MKSIKYEKKKKIRDVKERWKGTLKSVNTDERLHVVESNFF